MTGIIGTISNAVASVTFLQAITIPDTTAWQWFGGLIIFVVVNVLAGRIHRQYHDKSINFYKEGMRDMEIEIKKITDKFGNAVTDIAVMKKEMEHMSKMVSELTRNSKKGN